MSDRSTDSSVKEEELVYVRFCHKGKIESKFVGIKTVEKAHISNAKAEGTDVPRAPVPAEDVLVQCQQEPSAFLS